MQMTSIAVNVSTNSCLILCTNPVTAGSKITWFYNWEFIFTFVKTQQKGSAACSNIYL